MSARKTDVVYYSVPLGELEELARRSRVVAEDAALIPRLRDEGWPEYDLCFIKKGDARIDWSRIPTLARLQEEVDNYHYNRAEGLTILTEMSPDFPAGFFYQQVVQPTFLAKVRSSGHLKERTLTNLYPEEKAG